MYAFSAKKTKVHLKMNVERLKLLQGKKANQSKTRKREIAKLLEGGKEESARVMVEHVIREDFVVEAFEIMEVQTQLLLARMGVIEEFKECPDDIREAVCTLVWAETRCIEVSELAEIKKQMSRKYGKEFIETAFNFANPKVVHKLSLRAPGETLIASYLNEIARVFKVDWETPVEGMSQPPVPLHQGGISHHIQHPHQTNVPISASNNNVPVVVNGVINPPNYHHQAPSCTDSTTTTAPPPADIIHTVPGTVIAGPDQKQIPFAGGVVGSDLGGGEEGVFSAPGAGGDPPHHQHNHDGPTTGGGGANNDNMTSFGHQNGDASGPEPLKPSNGGGGGGGGVPTFDDLAARFEALKKK